MKGGLFIASLDGVGGIRKTALAHHFCSEIILKENRFNYLVWVTTKDTVFDTFSQESQIMGYSTQNRIIRKLLKKQKT